MKLFGHREAKQLPSVVNETKAANYVSLSRHGSLPAPDTKKTVQFSEDTCENIERASAVNSPNGSATVIKKKSLSDSVKIAIGVVATSTAAIIMEILNSL